ncbi:hypothetical protein BKA67DRAFT_661598 [Truncatella angustata]|uniref:PH domain-containing protein n=1 Tax=Truncatella angustata TaxID=152316 RepID=A0A9P8ZTN8_9PEZI|nr:uncharacterized protein BKA67DRAFT_661598 [Truncatella angustata]KAH6648637.1 hypothetical protein BKA67DRAFT_661598 [Truncatella angustata]KAH8195001.1 hypothetical protein TruAng_010840 [Truncatella angustata]
MASPRWGGDFSPSAPPLNVDIDQNDPFIDTDNSPEDDREPPRRYSHLFALGSSASPAQAKRALEAHLAETDRRMEEAGKLGTALVQQRMELAQRLEEVEQLQAEEEVTEDLRQKLVEIEKDYNDVARESARAFLPKPRIPSNEAAAGSPFVPEGKGGRGRSVSPSKFEAQATASPTKLSVPNRKLRNQPANRIHDIEFAAEISQSLIVQVRNLQQLLAEREEELRDVKLEKSKLEYDAEGYQQRVKALDESQNKYKDENWSLETQVHELMASQRESADREKKLHQTVSILQAEKNNAQRELDEVKLNHAKLSEEHTAAVKHHDTELGAAKRNIVVADSERATLLRKIEDLTGQNQELAKAVSSQRGRALDRPEPLGTSDEDFLTANDNDTPEHSPPPSPIKGTPRHAMLESETLRTSLQHAQRTIQSLRTNVHREKTEKLELRRMLQDARDELEKERSDPAPKPVSKRNSKGPSRDFKKPPRLLGGLRSARSEVVAPEDLEWEDQASQVGSSPAQPPPRQQVSGHFAPVTESVETANFDTANETSDQAFETANEQGTETDDFQTGAEEFSSDDAETETDSPSKRNTIRGRPAGLPPAHSRTISNYSTASTEDEYEFDDMRTPTSQLPGLQNRFPLRVSRGGFRRSRQASEDTIFQSSPAGLSGSTGGTPQPNQSLAAELGDFDGSDNESNMSVTPSKRSIHQVSRPGSMRGTTASPPPPLPRPRRVTMVNSGMMTEPLSESLRTLPVGAAGQERPVSTATVISGISDYSDAGTLNMEENLAKFPSPPTSPPKREFNLSDVHARDVAPVEEPDHHGAELDALKRGHAKQIEDIHAEKNTVHSAALAALESQHADLLSRAIAEARAAHDHELEILKSGHDDEKARAAVDASAAHTRELEALQAIHAEKIAVMESDHKATHASEIDALKASHSNQLANSEKTRSDAHAVALAALEATYSERLSASEKAHVEAHAAELDSLRASHSEQFLAAEGARAEAHKAEIEALKASHAEQLEAFKKLREKAHADELAMLVTAHASQIELARKELNDSHARDLDTLKAAHVAQIDKAKESSDASHAEELELLKSTHLSQIDETKNAIAATHKQELEALKAAHATQVEQSKKENESSRVTEIAALAALHTQQLDKSKAESQVKLASELESLKSAHNQQLESFKIQAEEQLAKQLDNLRTAHTEKLHASQTESGAKLAAELEALKLAHNSTLESSKADAEKEMAQQIATLQAEHLTQVENIRAAEAANLTREIESLKLAHVKELENAIIERDTAHGTEIAALKDSHAKELNESARKRDASHAAALAALAIAHDKELAASKSDAEERLAKEIASLRDSHAQDLDKLRSEHAATHAKELEVFEAALAKQLESSKSEGDAAHNEQIEALKAANAEIVDAHKRDSQKGLEQALTLARADHERELEVVRSDHAATRSRESEKSASMHAAEMAALGAALAAAKTEEIDALTSQHEQRMTSLQDEHAVAKAGELDELSARYAKQIEDLMAAAATAKAIALEEVNSNHQRAVADIRAEASASREKEFGELTSRHQREIDNLKADASASRAAELAALALQHQEHIDTLDAEAASSKSKELDDLRTGHATQLDSLKGEHEAAVARLAAELAASHALQLEAHRSDHEASRAKDLETLGAEHTSQLESLREEHENSRSKDLEQLKSEHSVFLASVRAEHQSVMDAALENLRANHMSEIDSLGGSHATSLETALSTIKSGHAEELEGLKTTNDAALAEAIKKASAEHALALETQQSNIQSRHLEEMASLRVANDAALALALEKANSEHSIALETQRSEIQSKHTRELADLKTANDAALAQILERTNNEHVLALETHNSTIQSKHAKELGDLKTANDAAFAQALERTNNEHTLALQAHHAQSSAEHDKMLASHASELEALRQALTIAPPLLGYSSMSTVETEPIEEPEPLRSPNREAFVLSHDTKHPQTPPTSALGIFGKRSKGTVTPVIAEDDTRQSPNATNSPETPESQRPFKEMSTNTDARPARKQPFPMTDHSVQTALTSDGIDRLMLKNRRQNSQDSSKIAAGPSLVLTPFDEATPSTVRHKPSQDSLGNTKLRGHPGDSGILAAPVPVPIRRPGSSGSTRGSQQAMPPLPANHKEVIEAARTGSSHEARGTMGPPLLPASAYKTQPERPYSARDRPLSPLSGRGTPTPRAVRTGSTLGHPDVHSPTKMSARSRQSSISSFTSEIDNRFNIRGDMMGAGNFAGPNTDPRMIQAITQTMIGEYLWKYTRKAGRGEMSGNRHRRYFWVHPYTRTLYWSDRDPSAAGRSELRAKSIPIEAVRVVSDDNPMPPGLHRKSLVIVSPGRTVKVTCTTGQRHETWFNALSYLLLRTGDEGHNEAEDAGGNLTQEDVDEFNPPYGRRSVNSNRRAPPSLSSYNSRTTRNESPNIDLSIPTLTPTHEKTAPSRPGTLRGLLNRTSTSGSFFSMRTRSHTPHSQGNAIYEASEVNDSAEELRHIIERQDRESDRLENVRACCDGKHDVGTLSRSSNRRPGHAHTHSHSHPAQLTAPTTPMDTLKTKA